MCILRKLHTESLTQIWKQGRNDPDWPLADVTHSAFQSFITGHMSSELLEFGCIRGVEVNRQLVGFITLSKIDENWLAPATTAVEGGTYILPIHRGRGLNVPVKSAMLRIAYEQLDSQWCLFLIPTDNLRARRAMEYLPRPAYIETLAKPRQFKQLLRRKSWEVGKELVLYGFRRESD